MTGSNQGHTRIAVGAANVCTSQVHYFDSRDGEFRVEHVMASGALPPPFPAVPEDKRRDNVVRELAGYGCLTQMHVVALVAPSLPGEDHTKDIDFSGEGIRARWEAGYAQTKTAIAQAPWTAPADPLEDVLLHRIDA